MRISEILLSIMHSSAYRASRTSSYISDQRKVLRHRLQRSANKNNPNSIFVWIPKSAGTSIKNVLESYGGQKFLNAKDVERYFDNRGIATFGHMSLTHLRHEGLISEAFFRESWKFTFVRNPYDRAVSLFEYLRKTGDLPGTTTFSIFCHYLQEEAYPPIGLYNRLGLNQLNPQIEWVKDEKGKFMVDFIGRFETLEKDLSVVFDRLRIPEGIGSLEPSNKSNRRPVADYYKDEQVNIVKSVYFEDFEAFDYDLTPYWYH